MEIKDELRNPSLCSGHAGGNQSMSCFMKLAFSMMRSEIRAKKEGWSFTLKKANIIASGNLFLLKFLINYNISHSFFVKHYRKE